MTLPMLPLCALFIQPDNLIPITTMDPIYIGKTDFL